jgi:hypothetical protein
LRDPDGQLVLSLVRPRYRSRVIVQDPQTSPTMTIAAKSAMRAKHLKIWTPDGSVIGMTTTIDSGSSESISLLSPDGTLIANATRKHDAGAQRKESSGLVQLSIETALDMRLRTAAICLVPSIALIQPGAI